MYMIGYDLELSVLFLYIYYFSSSCLSCSSLWPAELVSQPWVFIPQSGHSFPVRTLIFTLCRFCLSQFIEINYDTPLFLVSQVHLVPLFIRSSDSWFLNSAPILRLPFLPARLYLATSDFWFWLELGFWLFICLSYCTSNLCLPGLRTLSE